MAYIITKYLNHPNRNSTVNQHSIMLTLTLTIALAILLAAALLLRHSRKPPPPALRPNQLQHFRLQARKTVSPNTAIYRFALHSPHQHLGLPIGQHILIQADIHGKQIQRMYTPLSSDDDKGFFELMIKGNISKLIANLNIGDTIQVKGPRGQMKYHRDLCTEIGMIAGGTGITPMLDPNDHTKISLVYANVNPEDILLKHELDQIQLNHPKRFSVYYVLNNPPPEGWAGGKGFVTKEIIHAHLPSAKLGKRAKVLLCGPPPMVSAMKKYLEELEFEKARVISKIDDQVFCASYHYS
ncbi:hypothetical protein PtB15_12B10 [Puccinia triticina]|nr:hypothetical protein PtB15_12B10 [Puccinia triticina]